MSAHEIYLAGGCFWGTQRYLSLIHGVLSTEAGYANGEGDDPTYEEVCDGSGHAETVHVTYDSALLSLTELLDLYFESIDISARNHQGGDFGIQYRTGIYYTDPADLPVIEDAISQAENRMGRRSVIEVEPLRGFSRAEEYHQRYLQKNPGGYCHVDPRLMRKAMEFRGHGDKGEGPTAAAAEAAAAEATSAPGTPVAATPAEAAAAEAEPTIPRYHMPTDSELRERLTPEQYAVTREAATERAFTGEYWDEHRKGLYVDVATGEPLFLSDDKFDSGCGWPSFTKPIAPEVVTEADDYRLGMYRTEVLSRSGRSHLGHVFDDGPITSGGMRYCIDSAALRFIPYDRLDQEGYGYLRKVFDRQRTGDGRTS